MDTALGAALVFLAVGVTGILFRKHSARYMVEGHKDEWKLEDPEDEQRWLEFMYGLIGVGSQIIGIMVLVVWFVT